MIRSSKDVVGIYWKGTPAWFCDKCKRFFQTKKIALTHERRKHEKGKKNE